MNPQYTIYSLLPHRPPLKKNQQNSKQMPYTGAHTLAEFEMFKKNPDFFGHNMQITSELLSSDPCARLKAQIPMHSISCGCPLIVCHSDLISLLISSFGIHLEPGCRSHDQIIHYHTAKNVQKQVTFFHLFFDKFL